MKTEEILSERGKTNGDYSQMCAVSQEIKESMGLAQPKYTPYMRESIEMIAHKLSRIAAGDPLTEDHWRDIAGYATLAADRVRDRNKLAAVPASAMPYTLAEEHPTSLDET